ncbi:MAG: hypothetical protein H7175_22215 [Burkholderiales bacterium]|nr:hypothetical protein [Anaerolineae bacterium]
MPFVEPVEDIEIAQRMLNAPQCRLLTTFGISGIGKTALVTQLAFHRQHLYRDGAALISLKRAQSARDLPFLLAATLGVNLNNQTDAPTCERILLDFLKNRNLLLVLDNYEDVLPETDFLQRILGEAAQVQVIVASQAPLNLFREWLLPLKGLRVPPADETSPESYEAVRLFELTAQRTNPRFNLQSNLDGVSQICRLVDGLPLAIVIAAGWTQILPINKIIEHISEGQEFSLPFQQTLPAHHQSLEMMLEYTWNTLNEAEQQALTALSIFNAGFDIDDVQQICGVGVPILTTLIQRSLVQKFDDKYRMHQLVWRYARKRLLYSDQREALGQGYLAYFTHMFGQLQQQKLPLHEYLLTIEMRYASIWNHDWMVKAFQPTYILSISRFLMLYWEISRADTMPAIRKLLESLAQEELAPEMRVLLHVQLARLRLQSGDFERAESHLLIALNADTGQTRWADLGSLYCVYAVQQQRKLQSSLDSGLDSPEDADFIIRHGRLKLASLYLDMDDRLSADEVFIYLSETRSSDSQQTLDYAIILALRGTVAAGSADFSAAYNHFNAALECLQQLDQPALTLSLTTALMRSTA